MIHRNAREANKKLLMTAYIVAQGGLPLKHFKAVVKCEKACGVHLLSGAESGKQAREFIHEISDTVREKLAVILCSSNAFSVLTDGSQPRKTGSEKELVLICTLRSDIPAYYCIAIEDMDSYGDANSHNLKAAVDNSFLDKIGVEPELYEKSWFVQPQMGLQ